MDPRQPTGPPVATWGALNKGLWAAVPGTRGRDHQLVGAQAETHST